MTRVITDVTVYWDTQDPQNEGWAYRAIDSDGIEESGGVDTVADGDLDGAIDEACHILDMPLTHDDFAREPHIDGGCATWSVD